MGLLTIYSAICLCKYNDRDRKIMINSFKMKREVAKALSAYDRLGDVFASLESGSYDGLTLLTDPACSYFYSALKGPPMVWTRRRYHVFSMNIQSNTFVCNCMFYQLVCVLQSCPSTQTWGSVLPSIVETRDQNSQGCPLLFLNRILGSFCVHGAEILYTHSLWEVVDQSRRKMHYTCIIIIHDSGMRPGPELNRGHLD